MDYIDLLNKTVSIYGLGREEISVSFKTNEYVSKLEFIYPEPITILNYYFEGDIWEDRKEIIDQLLAERIIL